MTSCLRMAFLVLVASIVLSTSPHGSSRAAGDEGKSDASARLDVLLKDWDKANKNVRELHYTMDWTTEDSVLKNKEVHRLEGFFNKPGLERVDIRDDKGK